MPRLLVGDECDGIRFKYLAKPPSRDAPTFGRRDSLLKRATTDMGNRIIYAMEVLYGVEDGVAHGRTY